ncbi:hypothetical protein GYMLUDRAFT_94876, partial [Collybiopsis luxurians FD-317 M1]
SSNCRSSGAQLIVCLCTGSNPSTVRQNARVNNELHEKSNYESVSEYSVIWLNRFLAFQIASKRTPHHTLHARSRCQTSAEHEN